MLLPITCDAEVRHWPVATVAMMGVHLLVFIVQSNMPPLAIPPDVLAELRDSGLDSLAHSIPGWLPYALSHGEGLHPVQWLTSFLMHADIAHLMGNLIFLWVFGLIVEGFGGPFLFLALYIGIGVSENLVEQVIFLHAPAGVSLGASSAIFGLMMISVFWAPQDHVQCFVLIFLRFALVNVPVMIMGAIYFLIDLTFVLLAGAGMSTSLLHVMGGMFGLVAGPAMLMLDLVDCDNRDLLSMIRGDKAKPISKRHARRLAEQARLESAVVQDQLTRQLEIAWKSFDMHFQTGHVDTALKQLIHLQKLQPNLQWTEPRLRSLIAALLNRKEIEQAERWMRIYLENFDEAAPVIRLNLARIVAERGRPAAALKILKQVEVARLNEPQRNLYQRLVRHCQQQAADGALEPADDE